MSPSVSAIVMNYPNHGSNNGDAALDISKLSFTHNGGASRPASAGPATAVVASAKAAPPPPTSPGQPGLNILSQASNVTQLNANKTSFDPSQVVASTATGQPPATAAASSAVADPPPQQQPMLIPSFLIPPPPSRAPLKTSPPPSSSPSALLMPNRLPSPIPTQPPAPPMARIQQQQQRPGHQQSTALPTSSLQAALFQQGNAASSLGQSAAATTGSSLVAAAVSAQQMAQMQSQPAVQHPQQLQQMQQQHLGYAQNKDYYSENKKVLTSGRVPATRRDGRKLFVGGLPNGVSDLEFLQFFQQYGEVIDSVVLVDRRTKRSRGFGFVTFSDPNVAASLLNTIPGRTGMVNILGKNCEVKASEPKTAEAAHLAHSTINLPPPYHHGNLHQHHPPPPHLGWNAMTQQQQRMAGGGTPIQHQLQVGQTMPVPQNFKYHGVGGGADATSGSHGGGGGVPIYSHSTITRTPAGLSLPPNAVPSADGGGASPAVYIQNNFYTLPPGADMPPSHALGGVGALTPEALVQAQQTELMQSGGATMAAALGQQPASYASTTYSSLQPLYPGPSSSDVDNNGGQFQQQQQQQQQQTNSRGNHDPYGLQSRNH